MVLDDNGAEKMKFNTMFHAIGWNSRKDWKICCREIYWFNVIHKQRNFSSGSKKLHEDLNTR